MNRYIKNLLFAITAAATFSSTKSFSKTCYYDPQDLNISGDTFYQQKWNCSKYRIKKYWNDFNMIPYYWNDGFGYDDPCNANKPLGRMFSAIHALKVSKNYDYDSILNWAYDYTEGDISTLRAKCGDGTLNAENTLSVVTFYWDGIYGGKSVVRRAGILLHEARHTRRIHNGFSWCPDGSSCDYSWSYGGANQYHVLWLWWFGRHGKNSTSALKNDALRDARWRHDNRFYKNPGFNI
ncbi:MAG: hypothetical protein CME61_06220 [Halobacteriovoraceae bacterium]|nr:hypothetical protein [Halobacteriovoraceae bacterium]|tara:strand:+ start:1859 stop:2569 length:711 start_codon:yes stop_codon:yes gene_type:complete